MVSSVSSFAKDYGKHLAHLQQVTIEHNKESCKQWDRQKVENEKQHRTLSELSHKVDTLADIQEKKFGEQNQKMDELKELLETIQAAQQN